MSQCRHAISWRKCSRKDIDATRKQRRQSKDSITCSRLFLLNVPFVVSLPECKHPSEIIVSGQPFMHAYHCVALDMIERVPQPLTANSVCQPPLLLGLRGVMHFLAVSRSLRNNLRENPQNYLALFDARDEDLAFTNHACHTSEWWHSVPHLVSKV